MALCASWPKAAINPNTMANAYAEIASWIVRRMAGAKNWYVSMYTGERRIPKSAKTPPINRTSPHHGIRSRISTETSRPWPGDDSGSPEGPAEEAFMRMADVHDGGGDLAPPSLAHRSGHTPYDGLNSTNHFW